MKILALDISGTTGWATGSVDTGRIDSGTWSVKPGRGDSPGMRYVRLRARLRDVHAEQSLGLVAYEQAHHRGGAATEYAIGCVATVQAWCADNQVEHAAVHTATLKKFATGNGRASKTEMVEAARQRFRVPIEDDNEADALLVLDWALGEFGSRAPGQIFRTGGEMTANPHSERFPTYRRKLTGVSNG